MDFVEPGSTRDWSALNLASDDTRSQPGLDLKRYLVAPDGNPGAGAPSAPSASDYADSLIKVPAPINLASKSATNDQLWAMSEGGGPRTEGGAIRFLQQRATDIAGTFFGDDGIDNSQQAPLIESYSENGETSPLAYPVNPLVKAGVDYVSRVSRAAYNDPEGAAWGVVSLAVNLGPDLWNYAADVHELLVAGPWGRFGDNNPAHIDPLMPALNDAMRGGELGGTAATIVMPFGVTKLESTVGAVLDAKLRGLAGIGEDPFLARQALSVGSPIGDAGGRAAEAYSGNPLEAGFVGPQKPILPSDPEFVGPLPQVGNTAGEAGPTVFSNRFPEDIPDPSLVPGLTKEQVLGMPKSILYVVKTDGTLVVAPKGGAPYGHIDLAGGQDVLAAGEGKILWGTVKSLDNASGHYLPVGPSAESSALDAFENYGFKVPDGVYQEKVYDFTLKRWVPKND